MTETINLTIDSEELKEFKEKTGMSFVECIKILRNSVKYGGKVELDAFWSDENMEHLQKVFEDAKNGRNMHEHELIEVD